MNDDDEETEDGLVDSEADEQNSEAVAIREDILENDNEPLPTVSSLPTIQIRDNIDSWFKGLLPTQELIEVDPPSSVGDILIGTTDVVIAGVGDVTFNGTTDVEGAGTIRSLLCGVTPL